jgi:hypothetical protein
MSKNMSIRERTTTYTFLIFSMFWSPAVWQLATIFGTWRNKHYLWSTWYSISHDNLQERIRRLSTLVRQSWLGKQMLITLGIKWNQIYCVIHTLLRNRLFINSNHHCPCTVMLWFYPSIKQNWRKPLSQWWVIIERHLA